MLTPQAIEDFKDFLDTIIAYAQVTVNGKTEKVRIHRRERLKDGRVAVQEGALYRFVFKFVEQEV